MRWGSLGRPDVVDAVSEIGVPLLLFLVGLELNPGRLVAFDAIFGLGLMQVVVCGLALSALVYLALGFSVEASLALGQVMDSAASTLTRCSARCSKARWSWAARRLSKLGWPGADVRSRSAAARGGG